MTAPRRLGPIPRHILAQVQRDDLAFNRRLDSKPRHLRIEPSLPWWEIGVMCSVAALLGAAWWVL